MRALALAAAIGALTLTGCMSAGNTVPARTLHLDTIETTATYDVLQRVEGTSSGTTLLYLIPIGFEDKRGQEHAASNDGMNPLVSVADFLFGWFFEFAPSERARSAALYNAIESHESADAILAPRYNTETTDFLLFQRVKASARGKAVRYNPTVTE